MEIWLTLCHENVIIELLRIINLRKEGVTV